MRRSFIKILMAFFVILMLSVTPGFAKFVSFVQDPEQIKKSRPVEEEYCFDFTQTLADVVAEVDLIREINIQGEGLKRHYDVDFVVVIIPTLEGRDLSEYTTELFSNWQIGKSTKGKKGLLILIVKEDQKIKIEVGYDLEPVFTDAYVGQVQREMLKDFLEQADWERGFLGTIEIFVERILKMHDKGVSVRDLQENVPLDYYSEGAGAKTVFDWGAALKRTIPETPQEVREYFGAQPTPELAFERYMEFNARFMKDYTVDLFSDNTKEFIRHWRVSDAQQREEVESVDGMEYVTRQKGRYAVLRAPANADPAQFLIQTPHFFIKSAKGWQIDLDGMSRALICAGRGWHFLCFGGPYMFAFRDRMIAVNRCYPKQGQRAYLGLSYASQWQIEPGGGIQVAPEYGSPAMEGGIMEDDIILSIDAEEIVRPYQDWEMMKRYGPGDAVDVVLKRGGEKKKLRIVLGEPKGPLDEYPFVKKEGDPWLGIWYGYSEPYERDIDESFLTIPYVVPGGPADKAGLKDRDVITYLPDAQNPYEMEGDLIAILKKIKPGDRVKIGVMRDLKDHLEFEIVAGSWKQGREGF